LWAFFDKDRQTVHDKMVNTYVIHHPGPVESLTPVPLAPGEEYGAGAGAGAPVENIDTQLRRLAKLRDDGLITNEEYDEKREALAKRL
jgi:hypothetical protein